MDSNVGHITKSSSYPLSMSASHQEGVPFLKNRVLKQNLRVKTNLCYKVGAGYGRSARCGAAMHRRVRQARHEVTVRSLKI